jgi:hypothetical protein
LTEPVCAGAAIAAISAPVSIHHPGAHTISHCHASCRNPAIKEWTLS